MRSALRLARRGYGTASPNPMVGAILVKAGKIIGRGWHRRVGGPHAEIEALNNAKKNTANVRGATLYVTLEPCSTHGRTPPCTDAIIAAGIRKVVVGATDPNPHHAGRGFRLLKRAGIVVTHGTLAEECSSLNEVFNHWIVHRTPFVTVKAAMTLDGKIATASGESKWITGQKARAYGMKLRQGSDAILVGVNTILADDPSLTIRGVRPHKRLHRIVLDSRARTPLTAKVVRDEYASLTTIVVGPRAPKAKISALAKCVEVLKAPREINARGTPLIPLNWLLKELGTRDIAGLLIEGGGEVNASFLLQGHAHRIAFFYAPKVLGGRGSLAAVAGAGVANLDEALHLRDIEWQKLDEDLLLTARSNQERGL
jgi:diaminohydroxyphosphoribosylaminopyrimidine deaminase/5-amino-6-(5-phosphoribosylamino)uracil reductase